MGWLAAGDVVAHFDDRVLRPAEVVLLARYREALTGRVLDIGCGRGRLLGYLLALGGEVHGIDISPAMVEHCRRAYPEAILRVADVRELTPATHGRFDGVIGAHAVIDTFDAGARRQVLDIVRELLTPSGVVIFSSHTAAPVDRGETGHRRREHARELLSRLDRPPSYLAQARARLRERMQDPQRPRPEHHHIRRRDQQRQLDEVGLELLDCVDLEGRPLRADEDGSGPELYYIAQLPRS